jgi:hypothetical protein
MLLYGGLSATALVGYAYLYTVSPTDIFYKASLLGFGLGCIDVLFNEYFDEVSPSVSHLIRIGGLSLVFLDVDGGWVAYMVLLVLSTSHELIEILRVRG